MRVIYKYPINLIATPHSIPDGYQVVKVEIQPGTGPCMWALVDTSAPTRERVFGVMPTGQAILPGFKYLGSWQQPPYVWHLFDITDNQQLNSEGE